MEKPAILLAVGIGVLIGCLALWSGRAREQQLGDNFTITVPDGKLTAGQFHFSTGNLVGRDGRAPAVPVDRTIIIPGRRASRS